MRKLILGAAVVVAAAAGRISAQGVPSQPPAPVVPIGQAAPTNGSPFTPAPNGGAPVVPVGTDYGVSGGTVYSDGGGFGGRAYTEGSFLLLFINTQTTPIPLVTSGTSLGILGQAGTTVVINDAGSDYDMMPGMRFAVGGFLSGGMGFEVNALYMGEISSTNSIGPTSSMLLARPFFDPVSRRENAKIIAAPGAYTGGMVFDSSAQIWGFELNPFWRVANGSPFTMDLVTGFRFLQHNETLEIYDSTQLLAGGTSAFNGLGVSSPAGIVVHDHYGVRNQFYGGQIGAKVGFNNGGGLFVDFTGKIAIGGVHQAVDVDGSTTLVSGPLVNTTTTPGGFYTTQPNMGTRTENRFAVLPEAQVQIGYQFSSAFNVFCGYTFMYLSSAVRPGDQINRNIVPSQLPTSPTYNNRFVAAAPGPGSISDSDLYLHGFVFGATISY